MNLRDSGSVPTGHLLRMSSLIVAALLALLLSGPIHAAEETGTGGAGQIGAAFGDEAAGWVDPFPAEAFQEQATGACPALLDHRLADLRGRKINLCAFSGKVLLVVNTASR